MEFIHGWVLDPSSSRLSTHPQACRLLSNGRECRFVTKKQPGIVQVIRGGSIRGSSLEQRVRKRLMGVGGGWLWFCWADECSVDTWAILPAQRIFGNVCSSQHFPIIGMVKMIRCLPQNRCVLLPNIVQSTHLKDVRGTNTRNWDLCPACKDSAP